MKPRNVTPKPHTAGILAALTTVVGIALSPAVLGILPPKWAVAVTLAGAVAQSLTKGVQHGDTVLISHDDAVVTGFAKPDGG